MISTHVNVADLLCLNVQENLTMVLELVYSDDERRVAQRTSKQIWEILYKDTVAPMSCKLKVVRMTFRRLRTLSHHSTDSSDNYDSQEEDSVHETPPGGRETGYREGGSQDEVVGDTSAVGTED